MKKEAEILLRLSLAFAFIYAGASSILSPSLWLAFLPIWLSRIWPLENWLIAFSVFEILLALWILSGVKLLWSSLLAAAVLFAITVSNLMSLSIVFRDLSLGIAATALTALAKEN